MIDFNKSAVLKLRPIKTENVLDAIPKFLIEGEEIFAAFKTVRDQLVFTNKRIIAANVKGVTGTQIDYTSIPYSKIQIFSIETAGLIDLDCEIELFLSSVGNVKFEISGSFDIVAFNQLVSRHMLD